MHVLLDQYAQLVAQQAFAQRPVLETSLALRTVFMNPLQLQQFASIFLLACSLSVTGRLMSTGTG